MSILNPRGGIQSYNYIAFRILLMLVWLRHTFLIIVEAVILRIPVISELSGLFVPFCIVIAAVASFSWFWHHLKGLDILFYVVLVLVVLLTMVIYPRTYPFLSENWSLILVSAALYYFLGVSYSFEWCTKDLFYCSLLGVFGVFVFRLYQLSQGAILEQDDMDAAYRVLPAVMYLIYYASYHKRKIYWVFAIIASVTMFVFGTRGPIMIILVYIAIVLTKKAILIPGHKKFLAMAVLYAGILFFIIDDRIFPEIIKSLSRLFGQMGFSSRIFDFYLSGEIVESQGRAELAQKAMDAIINNPALGYGFTSDRYLFGVYPHNFVLELFVHFGVIIGAVILIGLVILTVVAFLKTKGVEKQNNFVLMLAVLVFMKLMVSGSYTIEPYFYFLLGVYVGIIRRPVQKPGRRKR